jgi:hypothetical protein
MQKTGRREDKIKDKRITPIAERERGGGGRKREGNANVLFYFDDDPSFAPPCVLEGLNMCHRGMWTIWEKRD